MLKQTDMESLIEAKWSDEQISKNLVYYSEKLNPARSLQLVANIKNDYKKNRLEIKSPKNYLIQ